MRLHGVLLTYVSAGTTVRIHFIITFSCGAAAQIGPRPPRFWRVYITRTHARTHAHIHAHTHLRTPLSEWSARRRGRYLHNTQQTQEMNILVPSGIRTREPCKWVAADLRLVRLHWRQNRQEVDITHFVVYVGGPSEPDPTGEFPPNNCRMFGPTKYVCFELAVWPDTCCC
jgi:hypothetical protein